MNEPKFRHEYKIFISFSDYLSLKTRISTITKKDLHCNNDGTYKIRSLYFDNLYDRALLQKINGVNNREKFRIRFYNNNDDYIKLEKKSKVNGLCTKISTQITRKEAEWIINGETEWMKKKKDALLVELYSKMRFLQLRPKVIVDYTREPYVYPAGNVRITFDYDLKTGLGCTDMFSPDVPLIKTDNTSILMEVKYDEFLPSVIRDILQTNTRNCQAFSKYCACRMYG